MSKINRDEYMAAVPGCCRLRTWEDHCEIMLCWSIAAQVRAEINQTGSCGICEFNAEPAGDFARIAWEENQQKQRVWDVISSP